MDIEQKIKTACARSGISQAELARKIGTTPSNFNQKLKRRTFTDEELRNIANALNCKFRPCAFIYDDLILE